MQENCYLNQYALLKNFAHQSLALLLGPGVVPQTTHYLVSNLMTFQTVSHYHPLLSDIW